MVAPLRFEEHHGFDAVVSVLEHHAAVYVQQSFAPKHTAKLVRRVLVGYVLAVLESDVVRAFVAHHQLVRTYLRFELVVAPELVQTVGVLYQEVSDRRVVTRMLTINASAVFEIRLISLSQQRIKRFLLFYGAIQTSQCVRHAHFEPLYFIISVRSLFQEPRCEPVPITYPLKE